MLPLYTWLIRNQRWRDHLACVAPVRTAPGIQTLSRILSHSGMSISTRFDWAKLNAERFEEIVYCIVASSNPSTVTWRKGPGDKGRDIQAIYQRRGALDEVVQETYFIEAKHHQDGVSPVDIAGALGWAAAELPTALILAVSSHLTTSCRDHVRTWAQSNPRVRVTVWERKDLENKVLVSTDARLMAVQLGVLPPAIADLLPPNPKELRTGPTDIGLEMQYRYWLTDEEADAIPHLIRTLERLGEIIKKELPKHRYFELTSLAVPNWSTFLVLLRAQIRLEVVVRDFLYAQSSEVSSDGLRAIAERLRERTNDLTRIGDASYHVD
jgi:hypothetical protein